MAGHGTPHGAPHAFLERACAYEGDDCLIWPYAKSSGGYGRVYVDIDGKRKMTMAHRVVLGRTQGPPPEPDMEAAHAPIVCHNPPCVNPRHLRWVTRRENNADRRLDGTLPYLSRDDVEWIRLYESRVKRAAMALMFGVSTTHIRDIQRGTIYKDVLVNGKVTVPGQRWKPVDEPQANDGRPWPPPRKG